jgi:hypothetical protein
MKSHSKCALVNTSPGQPFFSTSVATALALAAVAASMIAGCSSKSTLSAIQVGPITFTDANGTPLKTPPTALTVGQGTYADVNVTNDTQLLGVSWTVYCGSAPPPGTPLPPGQTQDDSCGTFTPAHTLSGPIPTYVTSGTGYVTFYVAPAALPKNGVITLYASSTSNPSKFSNVTLNVGGLPISVALAPAPPATLSAGASTQFRAVVNEDATDAGVNWTVVCGSSDCGSFNPTKTLSGVATTYTAPAAAPSGGTVQITATSIADPTKAASATISIM